MTKTSFRSIFIGFVCVALIGGFVFSSIASAQTTITYNAWLPKPAPVYKVVVQKWSEDVEKLTEGRIKIYIPAASLGPPPRQWELVTSGTADVALGVAGDKKKILQLQSITEIPFTAGTAEASSVAISRTYKKYFEPANEFKGVKLLTTFTLTPNTLMTVPEKPYTSIDSFKGQKIRVSPGLEVEVLKQLGAITVAATGMKSFEFVSKGTVDGTVMALTPGKINNHERYIKNVLYFPGGLTRPAFFHIMNLDTWNKLSPKDQKIIEDLSGETLGRTMGKTLDDFDVKVLPAYEAKGVKFSTVEGEFLAECRKRLKFIEERWIETANKKGVDGKAALEFYMKTAKEVEGK